MSKIAASRMVWVGGTASMAFVLAVVLAGCSGATSAGSPRAEDDNATTVEGREVLIEMVANDSGRSLGIDKVERGRARGDIICDAEPEVGKIRSCAYTPVEGFTGNEEFSYVVKDASGETDSATVYVRVKPAN